MVLNMVSLESRLMTSVENNISLFLANQANLTALAWLACLLCSALAWSGLGPSCLPCQQQQPAAEAPPPPLLLLLNIVVSK